MINPTQPREQDRIQCLECGRWYRALPTHLLRKHGLSDEDYRLKYGLPVGLPLVCQEWSETQTRHNVEQDLKRTLRSDRQVSGYIQRESVRQNRQPHYASLAATGTAAAASQDKTAARRELLRPYPVTVAQAAERLGCSMSAAYTFLSYCLTSGRLRRIGRGLYEETA
jgi:hypothetical protein